MGDGDVSTWCTDRVRHLRLLVDQISSFRSSHAAAAQCKQPPILPLFAARSGSPAAYASLG